MILVDNSFSLHVIVVAFWGLLFFFFSLVIISQFVAVLFDFFLFYVIPFIVSFCFELQAHRTHEIRVSGHHTWEPTKSHESRWIFFWFFLSVSCRIMSI